jgi:hypothetical protein
METVVAAKEEEALVVAHTIIAHCPGMEAGSRRAEEEAWALVAMMEN